MNLSLRGQIVFFLGIRLVIDNIDIIYKEQYKVFFHKEINPSADLCIIGWLDWSICFAIVWLYNNILKKVFKIPLNLQIFDKA